MNNHTPVACVLSVRFPTNAATIKLTPLPEDGSAGLNGFPLLCRMRRQERESHQGQMPLGVPRDLRISLRPPQAGARSVSQPPTPDAAVAMVRL